ncbi:hypothetical protein Bbelb_331980 [Branchiostoma belcheri]|nr:hypothetical protein Bbelb_331980 [Branchiostoma belcheri]
MSALSDPVHLKEAPRSKSSPQNDAPGRKTPRHVEHKEDTEDTFAVSQCATTSLPTTTKKRRTLRFLRVVQAPQVAEKPELQARARKTARGEDYTSKKMDFSLFFVLCNMSDPVHLKEAPRSKSSPQNDAPGRKHRRHVEHKEDTEDTFAVSQCATTSLPTTTKKRRTLRFLRVVQAPQVAEKPELQARARKTARGEDYTSKKMDFSLFFVLCNMSDPVHLKEAPRSKSSPQNDAPGRKHRRHVEHKEDTEDTFAVSQCATTSLPTTTKKRRTLRFLRVVQAPQVAEKPELQARARKTARGEDYTSKKMDFSLFFVLCNMSDPVHLKEAPRSKSSPQNDAPGRKHRRHVEHKEDTEDTFAVSQCATTSLPTTTKKRRTLRFLRVVQAPQVAEKPELQARARKTARGEDYTSKKMDFSLFFVLCNMSDPVHLKEAPRSKSSPQNDAPGRKHRRHVEHKEDTEDTFAVSQCATTSLPTTTKKRRTLRFLRVVQAPQVAEKPELQARARKTARGEDYTSKKMDFSLFFVLCNMSDPVHLKEAPRSKSSPQNDAPGRKHRRHVEHKEDTEDTFAVSQCATTSLPTTTKKRRTLRFLRVVQAPQVAEKPELQARARKTARGEDYTSKKMDFSLFFVLCNMSDPVHLKEAPRSKSSPQNDAPGRKHRRHVEHKEDTEDTFAVSQCATTSLPTTTKKRRTLRFLRVVQAPQVAEKPELQARARKTARGEDYTSKKMDFSLFFVLCNMSDPVHLKEAPRSKSSPQNDAPGRKHRRHVEHKEDTEDTFAVSQCATTSLPTTTKKRRTLRFLRVVQAPQVAEKPELQARARKTARGEDYTSKKMDFSLFFVLCNMSDPVHLKEAPRSKSSPQNDAPGRKHRRHVEHKEDTEDTFAVSQCATTSLPTTTKKRRTLRFLRVVQAPQVAEKPELQARARKTARGEDYTSKKMDFSLFFVLCNMSDPVHLKEAPRSKSSPQNDAPGRKHRRHVEHKEDTEDTFAVSQCATTSLPTTTKKRRTLRFLRVVQAPQVAEKPELQARARKTARGEDYTSKKMDFSLFFVLCNMVNKTFMTFVIVLEQ